MLARALPLAVAAILLAAAPALAAPAWLPPAQLGAEVTGVSSIGKVAVAPDGTAVFAWAQANAAGTNFDLQYARRLPGGPLEPAVTVPGTVGADQVDVAIDGGGNATIAWQQGGQIRTVLVPRAGGAGSPQTVAGANGSEPVIAVGHQGRAVVAWIEGLSTTAPVVKAGVRSGATGNFGGVKTISFSGNGASTISDVVAAVGDDGSAAVIWRRFDLTNRNVVEANTRGPSGTFTDNGQSISDTTPGFNADEPTVVVDGSGRVTALWHDATRGRVAFAERPAGGDWSGFDFASSATESAAAPDAGVAGNGMVVAAWTIAGAGTNVVEAAVRPPGGGAFADHRKLSGPSMDTFKPIVSVGRSGDALFAWVPGSGTGVFTVHRTRTGAFGPVLHPVIESDEPDDQEWSFGNADTGVDDEGNAFATYLRDEFHKNPPGDGQDHFSFEAAGFDAAAPALATVAVPPNGQAGSPIGMAAAAFDRMSPVGLHWDFGDGAAADGPGVSHVFGAAGSFGVTVTATDGAGNQSSATRNVLVTQAPPPPRIDATVQNSWGRLGRNFFLLRLKIIAPPKGSAAQIRCKGRKCPFQSRRFTKFKKGNIVMYKLLGPRKAVKKKNRHFRAKQVVQVRVTAPGYIGKVVKFKLKRGTNPVGKVLCLPPGAAKPSKCT
jgi:hypothetical protein